MNLTIARITARGLLGRRRFLLLVPMPILLVGLTALAHGLQPDEARQWAGPILHGFGFAVLLPLIALIVGTGVLGAEIDDGTIVHILTKPLPRRQIVLAKLAVAVAVTAVVSAVPMFVAGVIADSVRFGLGLALACVVGSIAYCAFFLLLSLVTRRPVLLGLLYVLLWEGLLGNLLAGTRALSIEQYVLTIAAKAGDTTLLESHVSIQVSIAMSVVFLLAGTLLAIDRLRSFTLTGETS
ncbi:MAG: type transport system permease protein [Micromonosporaceae bacterium]